MNLKKLLTTLLVFSIVIPLAGQKASKSSGQLKSMLQKADELFDEFKFDENFQLVKDAEKIAPDDVEVLWRLAQAHFALSDNTKDEKEIKENIYAGFEVAKKVLNANPNHGKVHKWYGILIGRVGELEGTEQKIRNSYKVAEHTMKAIELDPEDDGNYHVMGRWHYTLADLSWIERTIASIVYTTPPSASFEKARDYFLSAIKKNPNDVRHVVWLGKTYIALDNTAQAKKSLQKAIGFSPKSPSDKILQQEAKELLNSL